jgi:hypothetical protein
MWRPTMYPSKSVNAPPTCPLIAVRRLVGGHAGAQSRHLVEQLGVGERLVNPLSARFERRLLMDRFRRMGHFILRRRNRARRSKGEAADGEHASCKHLSPRWL